LFSSLYWTRRLSGWLTHITYIWRYRNFTLCRILRIHITTMLRNAFRNAIETVVL
jgi:hypothetical protein